MRILSAILEQYIPLLHGGTRKLQLDVLSNVCVIIGNNGSGKSSALREFTVYPSTSTDYEKGGGKTLTIEHEGSQYVLSSIFEGHKGNHSFLKDGVELNDSRNSTTQTSLCESHFGVNALIRDLTSGNINISTLSRVERKNLLAACYPSDLTFVLKYHQKISSRVRTLKANIKMLMGRQLELQNEMMDNQEFEQLRKLVDKLNVFRMDIDQWIKEYTKDLKSAESHEAYVNYTPTNVVTQEAEILTCTQQMQQKHQQLLLTHPTLTEGDLNENIVSLQSSLSVRKEMLQDLQNRIQSVTTEINEYEHLADRNIEDEIYHIEKELNSLREEIAQIPTNENIPPKSPVFSGDFSLEKLQKAVSLCHSTHEGVFCSFRLNQELQKEQEYLSELAVLNRDISSVSETEEKLANKLARSQATSSPNRDCILPCLLKDNASKAIQELQEDLTAATSTLTRLQNDKEQVIQQLQHLRDTLKGPLRCAKAVVWLESVLSRLDSDEYLLDHKTLEEILNQQPIQIYNRISNWITQHQNMSRLQSLKERLASAEYRHQVLVNAKLPAKELISKSLLEKKSVLHELSDKFVQLSAWLKQRTTLLNNYSALRSLRLLADKTYVDLVNKLNYDIMSTRIDQYKTLLADLHRCRMTIDEKQSDIKGTVKTQEHHRIRLNEEILPSIHKLSEELKIVEAIESALSPTSGLPHTYMIRFINGRINAVNEFIRAVWNKDMELKAISEDHELDFGFPVFHNRQSEVKDIAICSRGEQEIINLAWTLSLCSQMQLGSKYPIRLDECDSGMTPGHRQNLLSLLSTLIRQGDIKQLFLVNHHSSLFTAFSHSQIVCLNPDGIILPANYNEGVKLN